MKKIITIIAVSALFACNANRPGTTAPTTKIVVDTGDKHPVPDTEFFSSTDIVPLETNDKSLLADVSKIMFEDDFMAIADYRGNQICLFDYEGRHIRTIRHIGRGPKEYISMFKVSLDKENKRFIVFDDKTAKLKFYDYDGEWAGEKEYKLLAQDMTMADGKLYLVNSAALNNKNYATLLPLDEDSQPIPIFKFTRPQDCSLYSVGSKISNCGQNVLMSQRFDYTIYEIIGDKVTPKYTVDFGTENDCTNIVNEMNSEQLRETLLKNRNYVYMITDMLETDRLLIFKTNLSGTMVYDKQSGQTRYCATICAKGIPVSTSVTATTENNTDKVVSILEADHLLMFSQRLSENKNRDKNKDEMREDFLKIIDNITEDTNPVLLIHHIK